MSGSYQAFVLAAANADILVRSYLDQDQYSDLTVRSILDEGDKFRAHKVVLNSHSHTLRRELNKHPNSVSSFQINCNFRSRLR